MEKKLQKSRNFAFFLLKMQFYLYDCDFFITFAASLNN